MSFKTDLGPQHRIHNRGDTAGPTLITIAGIREMNHPPNIIVTTTLLHSQKTNRFLPSHPSPDVEAAVRDIMNVSIDWPQGREQRDEIFDISWESACDLQIEDTEAECLSTELDPYVLASNRRIEWPCVREEALDSPLLKIYDCVRKTGLPNMLGLRIPVPSQLHYQAWVAAATGHSDDAYVLDGIHFGFPLHSLRQAHLLERVSVSAMRADLHWLASFLRKYNGRSIIKSSTPAKVIAADSCLTGGGGTDMDRAYELVYSKSFTEAHHISTLEAINCLVALRTLVNVADRDKTFEVQCDSESAISAFAFGRARDPVLLAVCRAAWYFAACMGINIVYTHIPGVNMNVPDALSRAHLGPQHRIRADNIIQQHSLKMVSVKKWATNYANYL